MDIGEYRHNYGGFYKKYTFLMSINRGRTTKTEGTHASLVRVLSFLIFFLLVKIFEEEI